MCGIVGYVGPRAAQDVLVDGLRRLEYRGYDSSGVAIAHNGSVQISKAEGKLDRLASILEYEPIEGSVGIGHTRWARSRPTPLDSMTSTATCGSGLRVGMMWPTTSDLP